MIHLILRGFAGVFILTCKVIGMSVHPTFRLHFPLHRGGSTHLTRYSYFIKSLLANTWLSYVWKKKPNGYLNKHMLIMIVFNDCGTFDCSLITADYCTHSLPNVMQRKSKDRFPEVKKINIWGYGPNILVLIPVDENQRWDSVAKVSFMMFLVHYISNTRIFLLSFVFEDIYIVYPTNTSVLVMTYFNLLFEICRNKTLIFRYLFNIFALDWILWFDDF